MVSEVGWFLVKAINENNISVIKCKTLYSSYFGVTDEIHTGSPVWSRDYITMNGYMLPQ